VQETLEMAASLTGAKFVVQTALREAERIIEQERVIRLSMRDTEAFIAALDHPLPPNAKLKAGAGAAPGCSWMAGTKPPRVSMSGTGSRLPPTKCRSCSCHCGEPGGKRRCSARIPDCESVRTAPAGKSATNR
jgi:uncharacterized protein (DUF1778 family)